MSSARVLIAYPAQFLSREKFTRKVMHYIRSLEVEALMAPDDPNGFVADLAKVVGADFVLDERGNLSCTHGIIFDHDGSESELEKLLRELGIPGKKISVKLATVANKDRGETFDVYIGRGTIWGNPYPIGPAGDREEVLRKYQYDFDRRLLRFFEDHDNNVKKIQGKVLGCHCKPAACHGDILAAYVNSLDDGE
jgi:hypothetical protein